MVTFNGIDLSTKGVVNKIIRPFSPPVENTIQEITRGKGSKFIRSKLKPVYVKVVLTILADSKSDLRNSIHALAKVIYTEELKKLSFSDDPSKFYMAILDGDMEVDEENDICEIGLNFLCPDPVMDSESEITVAVPGSLDNTGTYKSRPRVSITVASTISYIKILHTESGKYIYIEDNFVAGDVVVIDFKKDAGKVTKNGEIIDEFIWLESEFFDLPLGTSTITITPEGVTGNLYYKKRWL